MNRLGLILATGLLLVWTTTVSSRSLDVGSESETSVNNDLESINIPILEFEGGDGDVGEGGARDKRAPRFIFRTVSCLFTFLVNPNCLQQITGGGSGGSGSSSSSLGASSNRRQESQPFYMISLPRYNESDSNGTATEYPIYPIESTSEYYPDDTPSRPNNPILAMLQWKMNLIPNLLRRFFPRFGGGGRRDEGGSGSPFNLGGLGLGGGRLMSLFGGGQGRAGGGGGGFGGGLGALSGLLRGFGGGGGGAGVGEY